MRHLPYYKDQWTRWAPDWHALTVFECIAELVEHERSVNKAYPLPPRAPMIVIEEWRRIAVDEGNQAIVQMMRVES